MNEQTLQQATALAAVVQAATLVEQLARTGDISSEDTQPLINALFVQNPQSFNDVYGEPSRNLSIGLSNLDVVFGNSNTRISPDIARYTLSLLHLEKKLRKNPDMMNELGQGIQNASRQAEHFGTQHENTIAALADLYKRTLSNLSFRIHVTGNPTHLQNPHTANRVRTLLLAGIRATILWRQAGGHRWHLLFKRGALTKAVHQLALPQS